MEIVFTLDHPQARLPVRAHEGDAGLDLRSVEHVVIPPGGRSLVRTGLRVAIPDGFAGLVVPRSGLALRHGVTVLNAPGTVDADYRGEVQVLLFNAGEEPFVITRGLRIAQMVVAPVTTVALVEVGEVERTGRGGSGFGSTGLARDRE